jgi:hypothetical protein
MASAAAGRGVACINFYAPFAEGGRVSLYHTGDDHWNDDGQALGARITADFVVERGLLK